MLIRVEIPIDAPGIDALLRRSFESDAEAKLVHDLREDGFLTLGLVATDDEGQVIGYVAFSPVDVQGEDLQWVGMAPLAVDEKYRGQGLARQLVYEGLDSLNEFGYAALVLLIAAFDIRGDPGIKLIVGGTDQVKKPGCHRLRRMLRSGPQYKREQQWKHSPPSAVGWQNNMLSPGVCSRKGNSGAPMPFICLMCRKSPSTF